MMFSTIVGHERPVRILQRAVANDTLAHAYLFSGQEGIGKKKTAFALAAAVNCPKAGPEGPCGECPSCRKVGTFGHPDVRVLAPDGDEIKIDQVRQVQAGLSLRPFEGAKKVLIVDPAERMNTASANAFLKTLEEPPGDALILLITALPQGLLPTIRSRCQELLFHPLPRNVLAQALMDRRGFSREDAWFIAALAQGSLGRGLEMDVEREKADRAEVAALWSGLETMGPAGALTRAEEYGKDRERLERLLELGLERLRDALVYRIAGEERLLVHVREESFCRQRAEQFPLHKLLEDIELIRSSRTLLDRRVSAQLVAENLFLKLGRG